MTKEYHSHQCHMSPLTHPSSPPLTPPHHQPPSTTVAAKKVLVTVRGQLSRSSGARIEMNKFLEEETDFLQRFKA